LIVNAPNFFWYNLNEYSLNLLAPDLFILTLPKTA
jgi:hypothetical protein